jgi:hypothetical protein
MHIFSCENSVVAFLLAYRVCNFLLSFSSRSFFWSGNHSGIPRATAEERLNVAIVQFIRLEGNPYYRQEKR